MNTNERTRPQEKRSRRLGLSLAAVAIAAAVAFGFWFFLGRVDPKQKLKAAMDNTLSPASSLMQETHAGRRQLEESLLEGYKLDVTANLPMPEFGALQFTLAAQARPEDAVFAGHMKAAAGPYDLFSAALYGDSRALQVKLGSAEAAEVYELPYGEADFVDQIAASPFGSMFGDEADALQELINTYHDQVARTASPEAAERRQQMTDKLTEQLEAAEQEFLESLQAKTAGTKELTLDGETVRGEIITWTAEHEAVLNYFDALHRSLRQAIETALAEAPFIDHPALGLPEGELPADDYLSSFDEAYAEFRANMTETVFSAAGEAVIADDNLYQLNADLLDEEGTVKLTLLFVSHTKQTPLDRFDLTFTAAEPEEHALESLVLSREKQTSEKGGYTDRWTFPAEDDALVLETIVGDPEDSIHSFSVAVKDSSGRRVMAAGGHYRDGAADKHFSLTIDEMVFDELNVAEEFGMKIFFETSPQTIAPLSGAPKNFLELTPQQWMEFQQYFTPFFGMVPELIA